MRAVIVLACLGAFAALGCKTKCHDPLRVTEDDDGMTSAQKAEEEKALKKQPNLCAELKTPEVHVGTRVSVRAGERTHAVSRVSEMPKEQMRTVEGLRTRLSFYKEHWRALHPGEELDGRVKLMIEPPGVSPIRGVSIVMTTLNAGFKIDKLHVIDVDLDNTEFWVPKPPLPDGKFAAFQALCLDMAPGGQYTLRFDPERSGVLPMFDAVSVTALPDAIGKACAGKTPCADVLGVDEPASHDFPEHVKAAKVALGAPAFGANKPRLLLRTHVEKWTTSLGDPLEQKWPCVREPKDPD